MSIEIRQQDLFRTPGLREAVEEAIMAVLEGNERPSAAELLVKVEDRVGQHARLDLMEALEGLRESPDLSREQRTYLAHVLQSGELREALCGSKKRKKEIESSVDELLRQSGVYRSSADFRDMIEFMGRFREYAPDNNMLVRVQNPSCSFYATARDWRSRFGRSINEDARPMLILAPMHPVMLVYDLDATEGNPVPKELREFGRFSGPWDGKPLANLVANAERHRIGVSFKSLSTTHGGFAEWHSALQGWKARIVIHAGLDEPSRFGVLCHEVAHAFLGHLGGDEDRWWPARGGVGRATAEIEAEAVAYIVTTRFGLTGASASYLSSYVEGAALPRQVSLDSIGKVAGRIEQMAHRVMAAPQPRPPKTEKQAKAAA